MTRTSIKLENAWKYNNSGLSFTEALRKYRVTKVTAFTKGLDSSAKTNSIKHTQVDPTNVLNKSDLLVKQLIDSDFIYSRKPINKRVPDAVESTLSIQENNLVCTLDVFKLNKSIKQFVKILEKLDAVKSEQKIELYVLCKNKHYLRLVDRMAKSYSLKDIIKTCTILPDLSGKSNKEITKYLFILGEYELNQNFLYHLVYYRVSLISKFNLKYERKTSGFYKIQNNLDDYKKLMFLFILIEKVLGKKNSVKNKLIVKKVKSTIKLITPKRAIKISSNVVNFGKLSKNKNINKEIILKNHLRTNNLVSDVPKRKSGLVLSKKAKRHLRLRKREKEGTFIPITPLMKNNTAPNSKNLWVPAAKKRSRTVRK